MEHILTVGHSTHSIDHFVDLLAKHDVTAIADVRSVPASRFTPQFNRDALIHTLRDACMQYVFLGRELGARSDDPTCYEDGKVQYDRLARTSLFADGIARLRRGAAAERIALMCSEQEPLDCHRTILVARALAELGTHIDHIHGDGRLERHDAAIERLMGGPSSSQGRLFEDSVAERIAEALDRRGQRIAYVDKDWSDDQAHIR